MVKALTCAFEQEVQRALISLSGRIPEILCLRKVK